MIQPMASSQPEPQSQANASPIEDRQAYPSGTIDQTRNAVPCFTVTKSVTFKPTMIPGRRAEHLSPDVVSLVAAISLSAAPLWPQSVCGDIVERDIPGSVPTPSATRTLTITHKTRSGRHYIWNRLRGGWIESNDGTHPRQGARGVEKVHSGTSHGGSQGGY